MWSVPKEAAWNVDLTSNQCPIWPVWKKTAGGDQLWGSCVRAGMSCPIRDAGMICRFEIPRKDFYLCVAAKCISNWNAEKDL
jgi:hypothetical protein